MVRAPERPRQSLARDGERGLEPTRHNAFHQRIRDGADTFAGDHYAYECDATTTADPLVAPIGPHYCSHEIGNEDEGCRCCLWRHGPRAGRGL